MNIQASSREEYFSQTGDQESDLRAMDQLIQRVAPHLTPTIFGGASGTWLGYGMQPYQTKSMKKPSEWPVVALASQKNHMSLYVMSTKDGEYLAEKYQDELGKVSVGKSCIRIKKLDDVDLPTVEVILKQVDTAVANGQTGFELS